MNDNFVCLTVLDLFPTGPYRERQAFVDGNAVEAMVETDEYSDKPCSRLHLISGSSLIVLGSPEEVLARLFPEDDRGVYPDGDDYE